MSRIAEGKKLNPNYRRDEYDNGTVVYTSYETIVAIELANGDFYRTEENYSHTTTRQMNKFGQSDYPKISQLTLNAMAAKYTQEE